MSALSAEISLTQGGFELDLAFELPERTLTCVFGPSGSGKTTLLRCLAGLTACRGRIACGQETWQDDSRGVHEPSHRRRVGYVFQDAALFPHLSVAGNLAYAEARARSASLSRSDVIAWLGLEPLLDRDPATLSGGQRQRVAIGRALLSAPRLLLLDEPVASLDVSARTEILDRLQDVQRRLELPVVYVSHAPEEVARLAEHLLWLEAGGVRASGAAAALLSQLEHGTELGDDALSVIAATVREHDEPHHLTALDCPWGTLWIRRLQQPAGDVVRARVWARDVSVDLDPPGRSSALNVLPTRVLGLTERRPGEVLLRLGGPPATGEQALLARITTRSRDALGLREGSQVFARIKSVSLA